MKIIFLDIDGVLNTPAFLEKQWETEAEYPCSDPRWGATQIDKQLMERLNKIFESCGYTWVVISSSWRSSYCIDYIRPMFALAGLSYCVVGVTDKNFDKVTSINLWLEKHGTGNDIVIVLDDELTAAKISAPTKKYLFLSPDKHEGLQDSHVGSAIDFFGG